MCHRTQSCSTTHALARILKQYGTISEHEQRLRLAALWLDRDIMIRVFNWDPLKEGY